VLRPGSSFGAISEDGETMPDPKSPSKGVPIKGARFLIIGGASLVGSATAELLLQER
jgi:hypothetical protein